MTATYVIGVKAKKKKERRKEGRKEGNSLTLREHVFHAPSANMHRIAFIAREAMRGGKGKRNERHFGYGYSIFPGALCAMLL